MLDFLDIIEIKERNRRVSRGLVLVVLVALADKSKDKEEIWRLFR